MTAVDRRRCAGTADRGRVSILLAGLVPVMLLFIALVWDASGYLRAVHRADNIAAEAARAAGQAIDVPAAVRGDRIVIDPVRAEAAAVAYLAAVGVIADGAVVGDVTVDTTGRAVTVTVHIEYQPLLLTPWRSAAGRASGHATAHLVDQ
jgi:Flp pilus assembly protein TadG